MFVVSNSFGSEILIALNFGFRNDVGFIGLLQVRFPIPTLKALKLMDNITLSCHCYQIGEDIKHPQFKPQNGELTTFACWSESRYHVSGSCIRK